MSNPKECPFAIGASKRAGLAIGSNKIAHRECGEWCELFDGPSDTGSSHNCGLRADQERVLRKLDDLASILLQGFPNASLL